uniref:Uncharacterized protein n=1 Tax=Oryza punctata TaxID=4537 RepID=A0A0E0KQD1_ORYPU
MHRGVIKSQPVSSEIPLHLSTFRCLTKNREPKYATHSSSKLQLWAHTISCPVPLREEREDRVSTGDGDTATADEDRASAGDGDAAIVDEVKAAPLRSIRAAAAVGGGEGADEDRKGERSPPRELGEAAATAALCRPYPTPSSFSHPSLPDLLGRKRMGGAVGRERAAPTGGGRAAPVVA